MNYDSAYNQSELTVGHLVEELKNLIDNNPKVANLIPYANDENGTECGFGKISTNGEVVLVVLDVQKNSLSFKDILSKLEEMDESMNVIIDTEDEDAYSIFYITEEGNLFDLESDFEFFEYKLYGDGWEDEDDFDEDDE